MNNVEIQFSARFGGVSREISVPWSAVKGLYARETGEGMLFSLDETEAEDVVATAEPREPGTEASSPKKQKKPTLTVVK